MTGQIDIVHLSKRYGAHYAIHDLSLAISAGQFVALVGPSGCGKTTLLRLLAGFLVPDAGQICFDGQPVQHQPPEQRPTALVFQNYALWPHKTAFENVAYGLRVRRWPRHAIDQRVAAMLALVELAPFAARYPNQLSGGQQQRVALARAFAVDPAILLLDEPLANLDAQTRVQMRAELRRLHEQVGRTTVYVTHDQEEALDIADVVVVLRAGKLEQVGTPADVYECPQTTFVAAFIGNSTLLAGRIQKVTPTDIQIVLDVNSTDTPLLHAPVIVAHRTHWRSAPPLPGQAVSVTIKPEYLTIVADTSDQTNVIDGVVQRSSYLGARRQITVTTPCGSMQVRLSSDTVERAASSIRSGSRIRLSLPAQHLHVFASDASLNASYGR